jgi:hypothetical protein
MSGKITAWKLTVTWDNGTEDDVSILALASTNYAIEQFCDYLEETQDEESKDE